MKDRFDEKLAAKIRAELGSYEPEFNPDHWSDMKKRMGKQIKWPLRAAAAALLCLLTFLPLTLEHFQSYRPLFSELNLPGPTLLDSAANNTTGQTGNRANRATALPPAENSILENMSEEAATDNKSAVSPNSLDEEFTGTTADSQITSAPVPPHGTTTRQESLDTATAGKPAPVLPGQTAEPDLATEMATLHQQPAPARQVPPATGTVPRPTAQSFLELKPDTAGRHLAISQKISAAPDLYRKRQHSTLFELNSLPPSLLVLQQQFAGQLSPLPATSPGAMQAARWSAEVTAAGFMNYNNRIGYQSPGFGAGLMLNRRLGSKFEISSGLLFTRHNSKIIPDQQPFASQNDEASFSSDFASLPMQQFPVSNSLSTLNEMVELVTIEGHLNSIEIPVSLRFSFLGKQRNRFYLATGFSAYLQVAERYFYEEEYFRVIIPAARLNVEVMEKEKTAGAFKSFTPFGTVHLAAGWEKSLPGGNRLGFEPYLKIPVNGIGQEEVWSSAFGLRLRYLFWWKQ